MPPTSRTFRAPRGTRDAYPEDALKRRYITQAWRDASIRHGFDEIEGPTFEHLELYTQKSGDEIVSQLFSFRRQGGDDDYALRPEFTPTLARMYAARANSLPKPTKWFTAGPYFRAEKPQRGRLREFLQWNCDIIGGLFEGSGFVTDETTDVDRIDQDAEVIECIVNLLRVLGIREGDAFVHVNHRSAIEGWFTKQGVSASSIPSVFSLVDRRDRIPAEEFRRQWTALGLPLETLSEYNLLCELVRSGPNISPIPSTGGPGYISEAGPFGVILLPNRLAELNMGEWFWSNPALVRGLAHYTGMVFEVIAEGERTVCGGGRYDNLIEMFGGPPTSAVGFGMGDVVLSLLLEDKGLMPQGKHLLDAVSRPQVSLRPDAFVITADEQLDTVLKRT
ncbi:MAG: ATP phosphoribosyltransferase regulatory subunit, partial [Planctomycetes bacterium]|nr:ATP phosphoribosyltransferase regulatory subunit [Planctomycetota bacterium]